MTDPFRLRRFVEAQDDHGSYERALRELRQGEKRGHWIWYVFPQVAGLGRSAASQRFAVSGLDEARAYLAHPVLGPRLLECARALLAVEGRTAEEVMGSPIDALKLRSSMTLFAAAAPDEPVFARVLERYFDGPDPETTRRV